jgi:hypothetical protein
VEGGVEIGCVTFVSGDSTLGVIYSITADLHKQTMIGD